MVSSAYTEVGVIVYVLFFTIYRQDPVRALIGQKPMIYQSIKHRKGVFYCFTRVKSIS